MELRKGGGECLTISNRVLRAGLTGKGTWKQNPEEVKEKHSQAMEMTRAKALKYEGLACQRSSMQQRGAGDVAAHAGLCVGE